MDRHHPPILIDMPLISHNNNVSPSHVVESTVNDSNNINDHNNGTNRFNFLKLNVELFKSKIRNVDWQPLWSNLDTDRVCKSFYKKLYEILGEVCPRYTTKKFRYKYPKWYSAELIDIIKRKNWYRNKFKQTRSRYYHSQFVLFRTMVKCRTEKEQKIY